MICSWLKILKRGFGSLCALYFSQLGLLRTENNGGWDVLYEYCRTSVLRSPAPLRSHVIFCLLVSTLIVLLPELFDFCLQCGIENGHLTLPVIDLII